MSCGSRLEREHLDDILRVFRFSSGDIEDLTKGLLGADFLESKRNGLGSDLKLRILEGNVRRRGLSVTLVDEDREAQECLIKRNIIKLY